MKPIEPATPELFTDVARTDDLTKVKKKKQQVFKKYRQQDSFLFPHQTEDYIDAGHVARLISRIVDKMDLSIMLEQYKGGGTSAYHPGLLLKVWLLGYMNRIYTSRMLAKALRENVAFMWISGHQHPDFRTLNSFRGRMKDTIDNVFSQVVQMGFQIAIVSGKEVVVDHTKMEADANRYRIVWKKSVTKRDNNNEEKLKELFKFIDKVNREENEEYSDKDLPEMERDGFSDEDVSRVVREIDKKLKKGDIEREPAREIKKKVREARDRTEKRERYQNQLEILKNNNSYSPTDNDATGMRMKDGVLRPGYNEGIAVENGFILGYSISQNGSDGTDFKNLAENTKNNLGFAPDAYNSDGAYGTEENMQYLEDEEIECYLKFWSYEQEKKKSWGQERIRLNSFLYDAANDRYLCPNKAYLNFTREEVRQTKTGYVETNRTYKASKEDCLQCTLRSWCTDAEARSLGLKENYERLKKKARKTLNSKKGKRLRRMRGHAVETPFGDGKRNHNRRRYNLRGLEGVKVEAGLFYMMKNVKRIHKYLLEFMEGERLNTYNRGPELLES